MIIYFNGQYIDEDSCFISPYDRGFLFSDGVYEVVRYTGKKFFEFDSHKQRLNNGLDFLKIKFPDENKLLKICNELIRINNFSGKDALIYIQITRGASKPRNHIFPDMNTLPTVFINVTLLPKHDKEPGNGVSVILDEDIRWSRCNIKTISLLPNVLARQKAEERNAVETVFVRDGFITEGTHTNFCGVNDGCLFTAPLSNYVLPGVTRKVVLDICKKINIPFKEEYIKEKDIKLFNEFMLISTTMDVTPVIKIENLLINNGKPGTITGKIQKEYFNILNSV
jgi:D-alanine transaminase